MKLDLFSESDKVLLLGEGNFSFSVCLHQHKLPIEITATCFEKEPSFELQLENVKYLKSQKVPVFFNVDATKLHANPNLRDKRFSKIIFNFPHIGGKMKIHLNRQLLREFFESSRRVVAEDGAVVVSLCRGQGGTPADHPQRRWDDSWQITEMAAHGDFVLTSVEPFQPELFKEYHCVGYRSQDVRFNLQGALVHVFVRRNPPYACMSHETILERLNLVPLNETVLAPIIYSELYSANPLWNKTSPVSFLKDLLMKALLPASDLKVLTDENIPLYVKSEHGTPCRVNLNENEYSLRCSALQVVETILGSSDIPERVLFSGMFFNPKLGRDFMRAPVQFRFVILDEDVSNKITRFLDNLLEIFKESDTTCVSVASRRTITDYNSHAGIVCSIKSETEFKYEGKQSSRTCTPAVVYSIQYGHFRVETCVVDTDLLCEYFFKTTWRHLWSEQNKVVVVDGIPVLKETLLYPSTYTFDITLRYTTNEKYSEERMFEILWLAAGQLIEHVQLVNHYTSDKDWSSNCYRITYRSLNKPLYKARVVDIHSKVVGGLLSRGLGVTIS